MANIYYILPTLLPMAIIPKIIPNTLKPRISTFLSHNRISVQQRYEFWDLLNLSFHMLKILQLNLQECWKGGSKRGVHPPPPDIISIINQERQIMPTTLLLAPPDFQTFLRHFDEHKSGDLSETCHLDLGLRS